MFHVRVSLARYLSSIAAERAQASEDAYVRKCSTRTLDVRWLSMRSLSGH